MRSHLIIGLGEIIWDLLPTGKQLGGAPTNFAYISRLLGNGAKVASRVGDDELGREALAKLERMNISTRYIQIDSIHSTGTVGVRLDESGEASFQVRTHSAWDYLELTNDWRELASIADAICFGTLGQRNTQSRQTILDILRLTRNDAVRVFDVNLRHSFFTPEMLRESLELATIVKLNIEELSKVARMLGLDERETSADSSAGAAAFINGSNPSAASLSEATSSGKTINGMGKDAEVALARSLIATFDLMLIAITHGEHGSLLVTKDESIAHHGFRVHVKDTIGAGDAFTAALVHHYLRRATLEEMSEAANRIGAWVSTQTGATPEASTQTLGGMLGGLPESFFAG